MKTSLFEAIENQDVAAVAVFFSRHNLIIVWPLDEYKRLSDRDTPLHHAVEKDNEKILRLVLDNGGKELFLNSFDEISFTPLMCAVRAGSEELAKLLLDYGANVNAHEESNIGNTALAEAVERGNMDIIRLLISYGADPNIEGWMQLTPMNRAQVVCKNEPNNINAKKILKMLKGKRKQK